MTDTNLVGSRATRSGAPAPYQFSVRQKGGTSVLYQLVSSYGERLKVVWDELFQAEYGFLRREVEETLSEYLNCGLLEHGAARVYCDCCKHSYLVAFSCKKRGVCPSCAAKRAIKFSEHICAEVLEPVEHRHVVLSIPKRLRPYIKYDRRNAGIMFRAAWQSISEHITKQVTEPDDQPGLILTLQTAGDSLNFNPHLHGLISNCLFGADGTNRLIGELDCVKLTRRFCELVLRGYVKAKLITPEVKEQILSQEHTGFSVWVGDLIGDTESKHFVSRYIERGPLSLERLSISDTAVVYKTKDSNRIEYDPLRFLAQLTTHVPNRYESVTRYYAHYSSRARGERKKRAMVAATDDNNNTIADNNTYHLLQISEPKIKASVTWAQCIKRIYEVDPLECPKCKSQMRIIAFMQNSASILAIMKSLNLEPSRAPPQLNIINCQAEDHKTIQQEFDYCVDDLPDYDQYN